jgi:membrane fusion protein (multidrug efflux system)
MNKISKIRSAFHKDTLRKLGRIIAVIVLLGGLVVGIRWLIWRIGHVTTDAAYVKADIANLASEVPGKIIEIPVKEGQTVKQGDVLVRIDPEQADRHVAFSKAEFASVEAMKDRYQAEMKLSENSVPAAIESALASLAVAEKQKIKAKANLDRWRSQHERFSTLLLRGVVSKAQFDEVETAFKSAEADFKTAEAQISVAEAKLKEAKAAQMTIAKAKAAYQESVNGVGKAEASMKLALLSRDRCDVKAPMEGVIAKILVQEGDYASPGRPILGIYSPATRYVEARFEEVKLQHIAPGKKVELTVDSLADRKLTGTISLIAPTSAAEFAIIPRDISAGEFTKVVQRVPVRIAIDDLEKYPELVPGLSVEVIVAR